MRRGGRRLCISVSLKAKWPVWIGSRIKQPFSSFISSSVFLLVIFPLSSFVRFVRTLHMFLVGVVARRRDSSVVVVVILIVAAAVSSSASAVDPSLLDGASSSGSGSTVPYATLHQQCSDDTCALSTCVNTTFSPGCHSSALSVTCGQQSETCIYGRTYRDSSCTEQSSPLAIICDVCYPRARGINPYIFKCQPASNRAILYYDCADDACQNCSSTSVTTVGNPGACEVLPGKISAFSDRPAFVFARMGSCMSATLSFYVNCNDPTPNVATFFVQGFCSSQSYLVCGDYVSPSTTIVYPTPYLTTATMTSTGVTPTSSPTQTTTTTATATATTTVTATSTANQTATTSVTPTLTASATTTVSTTVTTAVPTSPAPPAYDFPGVYIFLATFETATFDQSTFFNNVAGAIGRAISPLVVNISKQPQDSNRTDMYFAFAPAILFDADGTSGLHEPATGSPPASTFSPRQLRDQTLFVNFLSAHTATELSAQLGVVAVIIASYGGPPPAAPSSPSPVFSTIDIIGVGVAAGVVVLIVATVFVFRSKRKRGGSDGSNPRDETESLVSVHRGISTLGEGSDEGSALLQGNANNKGNQHAAVAMRAAPLGNHPPAPSNSSGGAPSNSLSSSMRTLQDEDDRGDHQGDATGSINHSALGEGIGGGSSRQPQGRRVADGRAGTDYSLYNDA